MSKYWSDTVKRLTPYIPGEQPKIDNLVKLNTNENPYGPYRDTDHIVVKLVRDP